LAVMGLGHGALLGVSYDLLTSGAAFPFVLERLSTLKRHLHTRPILNRAALIMGGANILIA
jgi:hypothetical protein